MLYRIFTWVFSFRAHTHLHLYSLATACIHIYARMWCKSRYTFAKLYCDYMPRSWERPQSCMCIVAGRRNYAIIILNRRVALRNFTMPSREIPRILQFNEADQMSTLTSDTPGFDLSSRIIDTKCIVVLVVILHWKKTRFRVVDIVLSCAANNVVLCMENKNKGIILKVIYSSFFPS